MTLKQLMDLRGRRALVTGGGGHLGREFAETLAELGADVLLVDRTGSSIEQGAADLAQRWQVQDFRITGITIIKRVLVYSLAKETQKT